MYNMWHIHTSLRRFLPVFTQTGKTDEQIFRFLDKLKIHARSLRKGSYSPSKLWPLGCIRSGQRPGKEFHSHPGPLWPASPSCNSFNLLGRGQPLGECASR